jgi:hypothetical protein
VRSDLPDLGHHIAAIARTILGEPNHALSSSKQLRFGTNGSVSVEIAGEKRGRWYDHEAGVGGGPWQLLTVKGRMTNGEASEWVRQDFGIEFGCRRTLRSIVDTYDYRDESGELLFQVVRFEPKDFRQRRPDGNGGWIWKKGSRSVPYRLPELIESSPDTEVWVTEGEKDVHRLVDLGLVATCNAGGAAKGNGKAKAKSKWHPDFNEFFTGRKVTVIPDNDDVGRDHAHSVAANLASTAARVRVLELPGLAPKGDVSDWLDAGGSCEELVRLATTAPAFQLERQAGESVRQGTALNERADIARLAALPPLNVDRELRAVAERLGWRVPTLRHTMRTAGGTGEAAPGQGRPLDLPDPEPWTEPVDGAELLNEVAAAIRRYVVLASVEADTVALWVLGVHAFDAWIIFPRLFVTAPEKRCGKTTLLDVLSRLVPRPLTVSSITPAALFRTIEAARPTLLLDEADTYVRDNKDLRSMINDGHRRDGTVVRTVGDNHDPRRFSVWAPIALAAIGRLHGTNEDRAIAIRLHRRRSDEPVQPLRLDRTSELDAMARKMARWARDHMPALAMADPLMPDGIYNRAADNWRPLLTIADAAGGAGANVRGVPRRSSPATLPRAGKRRAPCYSPICASCSNASPAACCSRRRY